MAKDVCVEVHKDGCPMGVYDRFYYHAGSRGIERADYFDRDTANTAPGSLLGHEIVVVECKSSPGGVIYAGSEKAAKRWRDKYPEGYWP